MNRRSSVAQATPKQPQLTPYLRIIYPQLLSAQEFANRMPDQIKLNATESGI
jgi:hypothetical protein